MVSRQARKLPHPHWVRAPAKPISYRLPARIADWWHGRQDARAGLPSLKHQTHSNVGRQIGFTPHLEKLRRMANDAMEHERLQLERECAEPANQLARVRTQLAAAEKALASATQALNNLRQPDEADLTRRRAGERKTDEAIVRKRRMAAYLQQRARLEAAVREAESQVAGLRLSAAELQERITRQEAVAAARARRIHEHAWRRIGAYWQRLVREHPSGEQLNHVLRPAGPDLPSWAAPQDDLTLVPIRTESSPELDYPRSKLLS